MLSEIKSTATFLKERIKKQPEYVLILGSGLGKLSDIVNIDTVIPYEEIPGFPKSTVKGHAGKLICGELHNNPIMIFQGRFHYYEGHDMNRIVFPLRVAKQLGADKLIVTNAAGGLNPTFEIGDLMLITDHINLMGNNPLIGSNEAELGPRFPDLTRVYDQEMNSKLVEIANSQFISLKSGVYVGVPGPTYETPAEFKYLRTIGGDSVGMSTVPEVIAGVHMGMKIMGISVITDMGVGENIEPISHAEVQSIAQKSGEVLAGLLSEWFK